MTARSEFISFDPFSDQALEAGALAGMEARWSVSASVGIPVLQDWHSEQHDMSVRVRLGPGIAF